MSRNAHAARLSIELHAEIAKLQSDLDRAKRTVGAFSKDAAAYAAATNRSLATIGDGAHSVNNALDKLIATQKTLAGAVNAVTGVSTGITRDAADIAAYGKSLDDLRAKFNPVFAAGQQYKAQVQEIRQAHSVGAISAGEMAKALARVKSSTAESVGGLTGRTASVRQAAMAEADLAAKANQLREQINPTIALQNRFNQSMADARQLVSAGVISLDEYVAKLQLERQALEGVQAAHVGVARSEGLRRAGMAQLSFQLQDIFQGVALGISPFVILAQQGGQVAQALEMITRTSQSVAPSVGTAATAVTGLNTAASAAKASTLQLAAADVAAIPATNALTVAARGEAGAMMGVTGAAGGAAVATTQWAAASKLAAFAAGPLGAATIAVVSVLGMFALSSRDGAAAANEKEAAAKALAAEMDNLYESNMRAIKSERQLQVEMAASAAQAWEKANQIRRATFETLVQARAELQSRQQHASAEWDPTAAAVGSIMVDSKKAEIAELDKQLDAQAKRVAEMGQAYQAAKIPMMQTAVNETMDAGAASAGRYDRSVGELNKRFSQGKVTAAEYGAEYARLTKRRNEEQAALDGANKKEGASTSSAARRAASIQRETQSIGQKATSLYELAEAYGVSDAAALRAEATMRAREKAIRRQADLDQFVADEMKRTAAERVAATAKTAVDLDHQSRAQETVNQAVRAGTLDAHKMGDELSYILAQREALAAIDLARSLGDPELIMRAEAALVKLNNAQRRNNQTREAAADLQRSQAMLEEIKQIDIMTGASEKLGRVRQNILLTMNQGFGQDQALARANAEHEKQLVLIRAQTEADRARKDGLVEVANAIMDKAAADIRAIESTFGLQTAEEAIIRLRDASQTLDFAGVFGRGGEAVRDMIHAMDDLRDAQEAHRALVQQAGGDATKIAKADALYRNAQISGTLKMVSGTKTLFKEKSAGYKAITAFEKAFALLEMVNSIRSLAMGKAETAQKVVEATTQAAANQAAGASKIFSQLGAWAFPVVGAMVAVLASMGLKGGRGGGAAPPATPEELQASFGTGTVYGDGNAKSASLANAMEILAANSNSDLEYSNQMLRTLRSIDGGISTLAGKLGQEISLGASGMFDTSKLKIGSSGSGGFLGIGGSSTTRDLYDQGLKIYSQNIDRVLAGNFHAQVYNVVQQIRKKSGFLGIGGGTSTSYSTSYGQINADVQKAFGDVIGGVTTGVVSLMHSYSAEMAAQMERDILRMVLPGTTFSTKGMSMEEIETSLQAYFSNVADRVADQAAHQLPVLRELQRAGEGMYETLARVLKTYSTVNVGLNAIGMAGFAKGQSGLSATSAITDLFGDLDAFQEATGKYADKFLTEAERMAPIVQAVQAEMARLNLSSVKSNDQFKAMVSSLDLTTTAGQMLFAELMAVAPAFAKVTDYFGELDAASGQSLDLMRKRRDLEIQIMELQGRAADALAARRERELAAMEEALRPMQLYIYALQDEAAAKADLKTAYDRESREIAATRDKYADFAKSLRDYQQSLVPQASSANAYLAARGDFQTAASAAALGDADAMAKLQTLGQNMLGLSQGQARTHLDFLRDVAAVNQAVGTAIGAADEAVDYQQEQLSALEQLVSGHISLNDNVIRVATAIEAIRAAQQHAVAIGGHVGAIPEVAQVAGGSGAVTQENAALRAEITTLNSKIDRLIDGMNRTAAATEKSNRDGWQRIVENDAVRVREAD